MAEELTESLTSSSHVDLVLFVQEPVLRAAGIPIPDGYVPTKKSFTLYSPNGSGSALGILPGTKGLYEQLLEPTCTNIPQILYPSLGPGGRPAKSTSMRLTRSCRDTKRTPKEESPFQS